MKTINDIKKYDTFIYDNYEVLYEENKISINYFFEIIDLKKFVHRIEIPFSNDSIDKDYVNWLAFNIGLLELVSYCKSTISPNLIINCGRIDDKQKDFFKKIKIEFDIKFKCFN